MRENEGLFSFYIIFDGIYGSGNVHMQLESPITARWSYRRASQRVRNCRALGSASCLLRQKNGSHVTDETQGIESALHRRDVWVSVGKQVRQVSRGTSAHFYQFRDSRNFSLLRNGQSEHSTTVQSIQSSIAISEKWKVDISVMLHVCVFTCPGTERAWRELLRVHPKSVKQCKKDIIFWNYIKSGIFPKINASRKKESSGRSSHVHTKEELQYCIDDSEVHEGIWQFDHNVWTQGRLELVAFFKEVSVPRYF